MLLIKNLQFKIIVYPKKIEPHLTNVKILQHPQIIRQRGFLHHSSLVNSGSGVDSNFFNVWIFYSSTNPLSPLLNLFAEFITLIKSLVNCFCPPPPEYGISQSFPSEFLNKPPSLEISGILSALILLSKKSAKQKK